MEEDLIEAVRLLDKHSHNRVFLKYMRENIDEACRILDLEMRSVQYWDILQSLLQKPEYQDLQSTFHKVQCLAHYAPEPAEYVVLLRINDTIRLKLESFRYVDGTYFSLRLNGEFLFERAEKFCSVLYRSSWNKCFDGVRKQLDSQRHSSELLYRLFVDLLKEGLNN